MMKYELVLSARFKKGFKLAKKRGLNVALLNEVVDLLLAGKALDAKYKDHELKGRYRGFWECHIQPDWLLVYFVEDDVLVLTLVDTGTHADLFE